MDSSKGLLTGIITAEPIPSVFSQIDPKRLKPHPRNTSIYRGEEEDVSDLVALIRDSGWVKPLVVTNDRTIISGHRRWRALVQLGWQSIPVEVREFPSELAQVQALLLENASRSKTVEQKVREAAAWKQIEDLAARKRQLAAQSNYSGRAVMENFPQLLGERGTTRDRLAKLVGLGSGRNYAKAAKVVEYIDEQTWLGNIEVARSLRSTLNEQSVDAAVKLMAVIKNPTQKESNSKSNKRPTPKDSTNKVQASPLPSCWNCQHKGEAIGNENFYCYELGKVSFLEKDGATRGEECELWTSGDRQVEKFDQKTRYSTHSTITLTLPAHLLPKLQDVARAEGMSLPDWATSVIESAAKASFNNSQN